MNDFKATPECWEWQEKWASKEVPDEDSSCFLELRSRIEQLEAQASNYPAIPDTLTSPPVATDEELKQTWLQGATLTQGHRAVYNLGIKHGQASSREVVEPAPVAGGLVARVAYAITGDSDGPINWKNEARAAILEVAKWMREQGTPASGWAMRLEQEAGR